MSVSLSEIVAWADAELNNAGLPDYPPAHNGLQLENRRGEVTRVASAVDACEVSLQAAVETGADLLLVHHGLFWGRIEPLTGPSFRKLAAAIEAGLAVYSSHLPLDVHPAFGNSPLLARELGFDPARMDRFLDFQGLSLGFATDGGGEDREAFVARVAAAVDGPVHLSPGGPESISRVGICTGGAGGEVAAAKAAGVDTFVTGEGPHHSYILAEELGVNLVYAGHYATETFGVRALAAALEERFEVENAGFLPHPTGL